MARQALKAGAKADARTSATVPPPASMSMDKKDGVPFGTANLALGPVVKWIVKCLYVEEVQPRGPILQWFLGIVAGVKLSHFDLRSIVGNEKGLRVEPPHAKKMNWHVVLDSGLEPSDFKGFVSDDEVIEDLTEDLWMEAAWCLSQGGWPKADDVAHKYYVCTSWLQDVSEKFRLWSFGRVLVVIRLAAQQNSILGHRGGFMVPYEHSEECERRVNAQTGLPTHVQTGEVYVKTWEELQQCLHKLLEESSSRGEALEVSKLKGLFRTNLKMELSETVFGHECLSRLLSDERLGGEFLLEMCQGNRYMLRNLRFRDSQHDASDARRNGHRVSKEVHSSLLTSAERSARRRKKDALPPPPGLSLLDDDDVPSQGLDSMDMQDSTCWPTPDDAIRVAESKTSTDVRKGMSSVNGTSYGTTREIPQSVKGKSPELPPGLTPEKISKKIAPARPAPGLPSSSIASTSSNRKDRVWTAI